MPPGAGRTARGLDPLAGRGDPAHRRSEQAGVGRVGHIRRHRRGVDTDPAGAQQLRLGGLGQQGLIQPVHRRRPAPRRQLHQRGRMRHRPIQRNPAKPSPGDRIGHLPTQRLIAQPVPELQKTSTADRFPSAVDGRPLRGSKNGTNGLKNAGSSNIASTRANSSGSRCNSFGSTDSHNEHRLPTVRNTMASIPSSTRASEHPRVQHRRSGAPTHADFFRSK